MTSQQPHSPNNKLNDLPKARIVERKNFSEDLFVIWLEPDAPFIFKPGQYVTIGAGDLERPYSIVSAPYEPRLELFIEYVLPENGGKLTPMLWAQNVGDIVSMRPKPKGIFTFQPQFKDHVMVGTVTGIVPYLSIIRQYLHDGTTGHRFFFMEGASHLDEFVYDEELQALADKHPDFIKTMFTVSRPLGERNLSWEGPKGRVNTLVEEYIDKWGLKKEDTMVYVCGHPGMIEDVKTRLVPKGWNVQEERFWKEEDE